MNMLLGNVISDLMGVTGQKIVRAIAAGALPDALRPMFGEESLRYALVALAPGYFWCTWHLWQASGTVERDLALVQGQEEFAAVAASSTTSDLIRGRRAVDVHDHG